MAEINLPSPGDKPWNLNPAITAINDELTPVAEAVNTGRLSPEGLAGELADIAAELNPEALSDTFIAEQIATPGSATATSLSGSYASKVTETTVTTGRLSETQLNATIAQQVDGAISGLDVGADKFTLGSWTPGSNVRPLATDTTRLVTIGSSTINLLTGYIQDAMAVQGWGITATSGAQPGERFEHTLARAGLLNALITFPSNTIPASGAVTVTTTLPTGELMKTYRGVVAGVEGSLSLSSGVFTFTRRTAGEAVAVGGPVEFVPGLLDNAGASALPFFRDVIAIIDIGKNNAGTAGVSEKINGATDLLVGWLVAQRKYVILLGMFANTGANATHKANVAAVNAHRARVAEVNPYVAYVDAQGYITGSEVWADAAITPDATSLAQQAAGEKPHQLSSDSAHLNPAGYNALTDHRIMPALAALLNRTYTPPNPPDTTTGLLALWDADSLAAGGISTWAPASGSRSDMTLVQATAGLQPTLVETTINGATRKVARFVSSSNQHIRSAVFADAANDVVPPATEVMLVNPTLGASMNIFNGSGVSGRNGYLHTQISAAGVPQIGGGASAELSASGALTSGWHVITSVFDGANSRIFVDGTIVATGAVGVAQAATAKLPRVTIGANSGGNTSFYNGDARKIALYNRALTPSDVNALTDEWLASVGL